MGGTESKVPDTPWKIYTESSSVEEKQLVLSYYENIMVHLEFEPYLYYCIFDFSICFVYCCKGNHKRCRSKTNN